MLPIEFTVIMEMFCFFAIQYGSQLPYVAVEHLKYG